MSPEEWMKHCRSPEFKTIVDVREEMWPEDLRESSLKKEGTDHE
jgi:hypothetical protein